MTNPSQNKRFWDLTALTAIPSERYINAVIDAAERQGQRCLFSREAAVNALRARMALIDILDRAGEDHYGDLLRFELTAATSFAGGLCSMDDRALHALVVNGWRIDARLIPAAASFLPLPAALWRDIRCLPNFLALLTFEDGSRTLRLTRAIDLRMPDARQTFHGLCVVSGGRPSMAALADMLYPGGALVEWLESAAPAVTEQGVLTDTNASDVNIGMDETAAHSLQPPQPMVIEMGGGANEFEDEFAESEVAAQFRGPVSDPVPPGHLLLLCPGRIRGSKVLAGEPILARWEALAIDGQTMLWISIEHLPRELIGQPATLYEIGSGLPAEDREVQARKLLQITAAGERARFQQAIRSLTTLVEDESISSDDATSDGGIELSVTLPGPRELLSLYLALRIG